MKKFLNLINIPKHIKNYIVYHRIEGHAKNDHNTFGVFIIDILILTLFLVAFYYIYFINHNAQIKKVGLGICAIFLLYFIIKIASSSSKSEQKIEGIKKLILKDDDGRNVKVWELENKTSLLIGKAARGNEVDIDLTLAQYATMVSKQHAVLNLSGDTWYIEDLGSTNGSGLKRAKDHSRFKLEQGIPYKLDCGDLIYIANIQILVK